MILKQIKQLDNLILRNFSINDKEKIIPSPTQMQIMDFLLKNQNNDIYQKDIEKHLNSSRATVSSVLQTMEKNKIIEKKNVKEDARSKEIIFSPVAQEKHEKIKEKLNKFEKIIRKDISDDDLNIFFKVTEQIKNNLQGGNN